MSVIPEYGKKPETPSHEKPKRGTLRVAAGILGIITGVFLFIGFLGAFIALAAQGAALLKAVSEIPDVPMGVILLVFDSFIAAFIAFILAIVTLMAGIRSWSRSPAGTIRTGLLAWSFFLFLFTLLALIAKISTEELEELVSTTAIVISMIGAILALVGGILVKPKASFGSWIAGSVLILIGIILVIVSAFMDNGLGDLALFSGVGAHFITDEAARFIQIHILVNPLVLIAPVIGAVALLIAPFIGSRNLWIVAMIGIIAGLLAAIIVIYYSATNVGDLWDAWKEFSKYKDYYTGSEKTILQLIILGNLMAALGYLVGSGIGIVALILGLVYVLVRRGELFTRGRQ